MVLIAFLILVYALTELISPVISKQIVDEIVARVAGHGGNNSHLMLLIALSFAANLAGVIINSISNRLGDHFGGKLRQLLTQNFYHHILSLPQSYFDSEISGKIVNQLNRGINSIQNFTNISITFILPMFLQSVFIILLLAFYNPLTAIFTFALFPIYIAISMFAAKKWGQEEVKKNVHEDLSRGRIQEVVSNIKLVKGFITEKQEYNFISDQLTKINQIYDRQSTTFHIFDFLRNLSLNIVLLLVNIIVFWNAFNGSLTIGEMVLIIQLVAQARRPLFAISFILTQIQTTESGSKEFFEILELPAEENFEIEKTLKKVAKPIIEFKKVSFKYDTSEKVLDNTSFKTQTRDTIALVGPSGAGKTTIVNLILKFYKPTEGEIYLNSKAYSSLDYHFVRNNIALVFQENELFSTTIRENVKYGNLAAGEAEIIAALKLANAWEFVSRLPKGLDSEVGERGIKLSGGQKQRIQIARAILRQAPILILDEATSNLDAKSEKEVQEGLSNLLKDKLVFIIAHRFSTLQDVDKVIVLDKGKIVEFGNPKELANKPGIYSELLRYQIEGNRKLLESFELY